MEAAKKRGIPVRGYEHSHFEDSKENSIPYLKFLGNYVDPETLRIRISLCIRHAICMVSEGLPRPSTKSKY